MIIRKLDYEAYKGLKYQAEIVSTFYNELARKTLLGKATITVKIQDGRPVIASLKAE